MNDGFVYIMYPVKLEKLRGIELPFLEKENPAVPKTEEEGFMPIWYGNACFPEDDTFDE